MSTLTIIKPDGTISATTFPGEPPLEALQSAVGGSIEVVPFFNSYEDEPCTALCNEDGKGQGLPHNNTACDLWFPQVGIRRIPGDHLVGPIAIVVPPLR